MHSVKIRLSLLVPVLLLAAAGLTAAEQQGSHFIRRQRSRFIRQQKNGSYFIPRNCTAKRFPIYIRIWKEPRWQKDELDAIEWRNVRTSHFVVFYAAVKRNYEAPRASARLEQEEMFANAVGRQAELCYDRIADDLGYRRLSNFWTWDQRARIYVYPGSISLMRAAGRPSWSRGAADCSKRAVFCWHCDEEELLDEILPHELGHLIFQDFIGFETAVPLWLHEGVAQLQERAGARRRTARQKALEILWGNRLLPVKDLTAIDGESLRKEMSTRSVWEFYIQALSLVDFLIKKGGKGNFERFCRQLRDGKDLDEALRFAYPSSIRSTEELGKKWVRYITGEG